MKTSLILIAGLIVSGCGTNQYVIPTAAADAKVVCKKEKPTGSNRPVNVCRPIENAIDRENTERDMRVLQRQSEAARRQ